MQVDFDGIMLVYHTSQSGPFSGGGGWAGVNGFFVWMSFETDFAVTRHEVGHNFGHPHHMSNSYGYRNSRPDLPSPPYDGFDMVRETSTKRIFPTFVVNERFSFKTYKLFPFAIDLAFLF